MRYTIRLNLLPTLLSIACEQPFIPSSFYISKRSFVPNVNLKPQLPFKTFHFFLLDHVGLRSGRVDISSTHGRTNEAQMVS